MKKTFLSLSLVIAFSFLATAQQDETLLRNKFSEALRSEKFLGAESVDMAITSAYTDAHNGVTHVYMNQRVNGLEVFNLNADMHLSKEGKVLTHNQNFFSPVHLQESASKAKLSPLDALRSAVAVSGISASSLSMKQANIVNGKMHWFDPTISSEQIMVKEGYFAIADRLVHSYQVEYFDESSNEWYNRTMDANSGEQIHSTSYTIHCNFPEVKSHTEKPAGFVFAEEPEPIALGKKSGNGTGTYNVFPLPLESPLNGPRQRMTNIADTAASPYGWHDVNGVAGADYTITRGNNVWAKEDTLATNGTSGYSPNGGDSLVFDYPYSVDASPRANLNTAIVNLFYWNNILHDIFYRYGFDEKSGNFQVKNYSGQGTANDAVMADAQDGSGTGNANFSALADGINGRMQMYLWPTSGASAVYNSVAVNYPATAKGIYYGPQSVAGPRLTLQGLKGRLVILRDSNATTNYGCGLVANLNEFAGKIVLIDRGGSCGTQPDITRSKIKTAQNAGAIAVIIAHNISGFTPSSLSGTDATITIPSVTVGFGTGVLLKNAASGDSVQITLFDSSSIKTVRIYDSDIDNGVMSHEYGHGVSIRLTGGPANPNCLKNAEQAGEGWSDFFCLALTTRTWQNNTTARGIGNFVINEDTTGLGIRNYRYTRNMTINPSTYNYAKTLAIPHGVGSVWCTMLYDLYWDMIDRYGFNPDWYNGNGGNNKMMQLVIDGLKLQNCSPGFVDARNAIIMADSINNGGANRDLLWKGFARRGLGFYANQGLSSSRTDGVENYSLPPDLVNAVAELQDGADFRVYPNPSYGMLTADVFGGHQVLGMEVFDLSGKMVAREMFPGNTLPSATIRLSDLTEGCYLVKVISDAGNGFRKVILH